MKLADDCFFAFNDGPISFWAVCYTYEDRAAQAVRNLKYRRSTSLAGFMAAEMEKARCLYADSLDTIIPVPIHWSRRCQRGFNQAELLCESMPRNLVQPKLLRRIRATRPQVGLTHEERLTNLRGAFQAGNVEGKSVLLVDDVLTSGQTARECAQALMDAGALEVGFLAFAGSVE